jgi:hypothetical protein
MSSVEISGSNAATLVSPGSDSVMCIDVKRITRKTASKTPAQNFNGV